MGILPDSLDLYTGRVKAAKGPTAPFEYSGFKARLRDFMRERDWKQFHNPKDLAIAISLGDSFPRVLAWRGDPR